LEAVDGEHDVANSLKIKYGGLPKRTKVTSERSRLMRFMLLMLL